MRGDAPISRIYRLGESHRPDPERTFARIWAWCRDLWVKQGTIVAKPCELPEELREPLVTWANETYGQSKRNGHKKAG